MRTRTLIRFLVPILCALCSCSSQKSNTSVADSTGGAQAETGGAGGDAALANSGGNTSELGGATGNPTASGGNSASSSASSLNSGGSNSQGGAANTGGTLATGGTTFSQGLPSQCSRSAKPGQSQPISVQSVDSASQFAAITPDELTLVLALQGASGVTINVADRTSPSASWNSVQTIVDVAAADGRVAVSPDGLTLAYVDSSNRRQFATMSRLDRSATFQADDTKSGADFIVQNSASLLAPDDSYAYPLFGPYMTSFYYAVKKASGGYKWYVAGRFEVQGVFSEGTPIAFAHEPGAALALSGVASDENTLIFVDTNTGESSWTFYDEQAIAFGTFSILGSFGFVQPNQSCTRLYGGAPGSLNAIALQ